MKSKSSTNTVKVDNEIDTPEKPGTSEEILDEGSRGQKRKSEDGETEESSSKKVSDFKL